MQCMVDGRREGGRWENNMHLIGHQDPFSHGLSTSSFVGAIWVQYSHQVPVIRQIFMCTLELSHNIHVSAIA